MEPAAATEVKPKERKKIHFGVPDSESADLEGDGEARERKKIHFGVPDSESADLEGDGEAKERKKIHFGVPDSESADLEGDGEARERKKIHFAVPTTAPSNLDPRQVEMIRRRRPTPATLFRVADQTSPEDDQSTHQGKGQTHIRENALELTWVVGENGVLKPKRVNPNVYQPPSLKAVQKMAEAQMLHLGIYPPMEDPYEGEEYEDYPHRDEDQQDTTNNFDQAGRASREIESAKQTQVEEEEEEGIAEGNMDVKTEEKTQGSD